jgi:hypothetical protein
MQFFFFAVAFYYKGFHYFSFSFLIIPIARHDTPNDYRCLQPALTGFGMALLQDLHQASPYAFETIVLRQAMLTKSHWAVCIIRICLIV